MRYSAGGYPGSPEEGCPVCDVSATPGSIGSFVQNGLTNGVTYYYSAFSYDSVPNYSAAARSSAAPRLMSIAYARREVPDGQRRQNRQGLLARIILHELERGTLCC